VGNDRYFRQIALALCSDLALSLRDTKIATDPQPVDPPTSLYRTHPRGTAAAFRGAYRTRTIRAQALWDMEGLFV
jgi:hypothetical protein